VSEAGSRRAGADEDACPRVLPGPARVAIVLAVAAIVGLSSTWAAIATGAGFGALRAGPWEAFPRTGALDADPYTRAALARTGAVPLGLGEGVAFTARRDSANAPLSSACTYQVSGRFPAARAWTLTAQDRAGHVMDNPAGRYGMTSAEVVRGGDGRLTVTVAREASPGNWLPLGDAGPFELVLRLYDTPVGGATAAVDPATVPSIVRVGCP
jgi:hypothetical protein